MSAIQYIPLSELIESAISGFASGIKDVSGVAQVRMNNIESDGKWNWSQLRRVPTSLAKEKYYVHSGDVLFNATNSPNLVGKAAFFEGFPEPIVFSNHFVRIRPRAERLDGRYLSRWLNTLWTQRVFESGCTQWVNQATYRKDDLLSLTIPLPPLPEQKRIAAILDKADSLRTKRRETIKQLDKLAQSLFIEMFGDPVTNPKSWNLERIGSVVATCHNWNPRRSNIESFDYIDLSSIDKESKSISSVDRYLSNEAPSRARQIVKRGDVLVATVRPNLNGVALVTEEYDGMTASTGYCVLRPAKNKVTPEYLFQWVRTEVFINKMIDVAIGANYPAISDVKVKESILPIPPIDLQQRFASIVTSIENHKTRRQTQLAELDTLFTSLQARAFKGEL